MQSMRSAVPDAVTNVVSTISVVPRYCRVTSNVSSGAIDQRPFSGVPTSAAQHAGESNRGNASQSMEPRSETRAALCVSPSSAYDSSGSDIVRHSPARPRPKRPPQPNAR
jgi:hypothetical protein